MAIARSHLKWSRSTPLRQVRNTFATGMFVAAAAALAFTGVLELLRRPDFVDHVTVVNPTRVALDVDVDPGNGYEWMGLTVVAPRSEKRIYDVIDQGETWVFRFQNAGETIDEVTISRHQLMLDRWRVIVPVSPRA